MGQAIQKLTSGSSSVPESRQQHPLAPYTVFTDLYEHHPWEEAAVRKLILGNVLAPIVKGSEASGSVNITGLDECPICFLFNSQVKTCLLIPASYFLITSFFR